MADTSLGKASMGVKIVEFLLACICIGLFMHSHHMPVPQHTLISIVFGGYIIITAGVLLGFFIGDRICRAIDMFYSLIGMALFVAAGGVLIAYHSNKGHNYYSMDIGLAAGSLAIINAILLLIDGVISFKDVHEYLPH